MSDATPQAGRSVRSGRPAMTFTVALLATALGHGQSPSTTPSSGQATSPVTVVGRVVEADGKTPVASAVVAMNAPGAGPNQSDRVLTDAQGRFFFSSVPAGTYPLTVDKPGYLSGAFGEHRPGGISRALDLTQGRPAGEVTLTLWRSAILTGRVLDDAGEPMVNVAVRAARLQFLAGHRQLAVMTKTRTDDRGVYRFSSLSPGDYVLIVAATVTSEPATYAGAIRLEGDLPHAFLQTMTAVGTAPLVAYESVTGVTGSRSMLAASALGVTNVPPRQGAWMAYPTTYLTSATKLSSATVVQAVSGRVQTLPDLQVRLTATYQVSGQVMGPDGPAAYYAVHLVAAEEADGPLFDAATAVTDASGTFTFYGVAPGQYVARVVKTQWPTSGRGLVVASMGGDSDAWIAGQGRGGPTPVPTEPLLAATQAITVGERDLPGITLMLHPGPRVAGHAQFVGSAPQPATTEWATIAVSLEPANGQAFAAVVPGRFDATGQFATPSSWPARYLIRATAPQGWTFDRAVYQGRDVSETPIDLVSDLDDVVLMFTDHPARISGTVERTDAERPDGADVLLFPVDPAGWVDYGRTSRCVRMVPSGPTGAYSLSAPPGGDYYLAAIPDDQAADWRDPAFLRKVSALADRITVSDGQPVTHTLHVRRLQ
jgi:protocatechuate 3,4-dioxygenase beta subunit